ncbi:MAG: hypothetical protein D3924_15675, partial [Candidatus Electrothrix sp. AR4]|nr:hypothetical protein [Candidatus Electrothrix sp. AR4]
KEFDALDNEVTGLGAGLKESRERVEGRPGADLQENKELESEPRADLKGNKEQAESKGGDAVAEYNKKVKFYNDKVAELKKLQEAYDAKNRPYLKKIDKFNKECNGQIYYEDDHAEMVKEMGRGM